MMDWGWIGIIVGIIALIGIVFAKKEMKKADTLEEIRSVIDKTMVILALYWVMIVCTVVDTVSHIPPVRPFHLVLIVPIIMGIVSSIRLYGLYGKLDKEIR